jgi:hypothetical protein
MPQSTIPRGHLEGGSEALVREAAWRKGGLPWLISEVKAVGSSPSKP